MAFIFFCVVILASFVAIIETDKFLKEDIGLQTTAQICRSEGRAPVDEAVSGAIAALGTEVVIIGQLILGAPPEEREELLEQLSEANRTLKAATDSLTETTRAQAEIVEACNKASAEGQEVETTDVATTSTEGE